MELMVSLFAINGLILLVGSVVMYRELWRLQKALFSLVKELPRVPERMPSTEAPKQPAASNIIVFNSATKE